VASVSEKGSAIELPAREIRDKESNLDFHVQSVASCRLDDPGAKSSCELCFPCHSPTLRPWIAARAVLRTRPTWRGFGARASVVRSEKRRQKQTLLRCRLFARDVRGSFSLRRGLESISVFSSW